MTSFKQSAHWWISWKNGGKHRDSLQEQVLWFVSSFVWAQFVVIDVLQLPKCLSSLTLGSVRSALNYDRLRGSSLLCVCTNDLQGGLSEANWGQKCGNEIIRFVSLAHAQRWFGRPIRVSADHWSNRAKYGLRLLHFMINVPLRSNGYSGRSCPIATMYNLNLEYRPFVGQGSVMLIATRTRSVPPRPGHPWPGHLHLPRPSKMAWVPATYGPARLRRAGPQHMRRGWNAPVQSASRAGAA